MACCILLDISTIFCKNIIVAILPIIFARFGFFEVFRAFFLHVLRYQLETWYIHAVGRVTHVKFEFHLNRDTVTYFTAKNRSKSFFCIHGLKNHIEASDLVHSHILWVSWSLLIFVMVGQFLALWRTKTLERGCYYSSQPAKSFLDFFVHVLRYQFETWHIHLVGGVTCQVRVSFQSWHFDLLNSQK